MASLIQPYVDDENATSLLANSRKSRNVPLGTRPNIAKTFGSRSQATPRKPLGNLSNDQSARQPLSNVKNTLQKQQSNMQKVLKKPPPLSFKTPGGLAVRKGSTNCTPAKQQLLKKKGPKLQASLLSVPTPKPISTIPDIEKMFIFEEPDLPDTLPDELCLSRHLNSFFRKPFPIPQPVRKPRAEYNPPDFSKLKLEEDLRPIFDEPESFHKISLASCLDLPPLDTEDLLDITKLKIWED